MLKLATCFREVQTGAPLLTILAPLQSLVAPEVEIRRVPKEYNNLAQSTVGMSVLRELKIVSSACI